MLLDIELAIEPVKSDVKLLGGFTCPVSSASNTPASAAPVLSSRQEFSCDVSLRESDPEPPQPLYRPMDSSSDVLCAWYLPREPG